MARRSLARSRRESQDQSHTQERDCEALSDWSPSAAPLDPAVRARMEPGFHFDFSQVRVHADQSAHELADAANATAFTVGSDIYFSEGAYAPRTHRGDEVIAHELAHVVQRASSEVSTSAVSRGSDAAEHEASQGAANVLAGGSAGSLGAVPAVVAREAKEGKEEESLWGTLSELVKVPEDTGAADVLKEAGAAKGPFEALSPISSVLGMFGGADKAVESARKGDMLGTVSGATGLVGSDMGLTGWLMKNVGGNEMLGKAFGGVGGLFSAASSGMDAVSDFRDGNYGKGALDTTKTAASGMSGLATLGGFELGTVANMEAGAALLGGGGEGLAALGPAGAVLGSGLAGYGLGTAGLGLANDYAKSHDIFGEGRDSTDAASDAGLAVRDYFHDSWAGGVGDVFGDVAGGITAAGAGIGTAAYSGLHAAGSAISDFFSGPSIMDVVQQQVAAAQISNSLSETMSARDNEEIQRELYGQ